MKLDKKDIIKYIELDKSSAENTAHFFSKIKSEEDAKPYEMHALALEQAIEIISESIEKEQQEPRSIWNIQTNEWYWFLNCEGDIVKSKWRNWDCDKQCRANDNAFITEQDCINKQKFNEVKAEIEQWKWENDRDYGEVKQWYFCIGALSIEIKVFNASYIYSEKWRYFLSKEKAKACIQAIGEERIKKYIFGVE